MAKLNLCASLGLFCAVAAVVLLIFAEISQISAGQRVPRVLRMVTVDTTNFGTALAASGASTSSLYGSGVRTGGGQGLRQFYEWGLWTNCEAAAKGSTDGAYCFPTSWGYRFQPTSTILADVPDALRTDVINALPSGVFTNDSYLGRYTHVAFYLIFVGAILAGVGFITGFMAHRFAFLLSAVSGFLAFLCIGVGAALWQAILYRTKRAINNAVLGGVSLGITVSYGNCLWIVWAAALASLLSVLPFLLACCFGGSRRDADYDDEKY